MKQHLFIMLLLIGWSNAFSQTSKATEEALVKACLEATEITEIINEVFPTEVVLLKGAFPFSEGFETSVNGKDLVFKTKEELNASSSNANLVFWRIQTVGEIAYVNFILDKKEAGGSNFAIKLHKEGGVWVLLEVKVEGGEK